MRWPKWELAAGPGDFMPMVIGCAMLFLSVPPFVLLLYSPDRDSGPIVPALLVIIGLGMVLGFGFVVLGVRLLSMPGSLLYRLAHGRLFGR
jgi:hypothetical protein